MLEASAAEAPERRARARCFCVARVVLRASLESFRFSEIVPLRRGSYFAHAPPMCRSCGAQAPLDCGQSLPNFAPMLAEQLWPVF